MLNLNLLNPKERNKAKNIKTLFILKHVFFQLSLMIVIVAGIMYFSIFLIDTKIESVSEQIDKELQIRKDGHLNSIEDATKLLNTQLDLVSQIQNKHLLWTVILNNVSTLIPAGISVNQLDLTTNILIEETNKTFKIEGNATTREDLIKLEDNMKNSNLFENINSPISNLIQKENIDFTITGNITDEIKN